MSPYWVNLFSHLPQEVITCVGADIAGSSTRWSGIRVARLRASGCGLHAAPGTIEGIIANDSSSLLILIHFAEISHEVICITLDINILIGSKARTIETIQISGWQDIGYFAHWPSQAIINIT